MPLFLRHRLVFVHIPKTAGTSLLESMRELGDPPIFYSPEHEIVDGHSPQHSTLEELKQLSLIVEGFRVFTVVRDPYDRFCSEYNYRRTIHGMGDSPEMFAERFFDPSQRFDNHERSQSEFLFLDGALPPWLTIVRFENLHDELRDKIGLTLKYWHNQSDVFLTRESMSTAVRSRVSEYWGEDFQLFSYPRS